MLRWEVGSCLNALVGHCPPGTEPVRGTWRSQAARPRQTARPHQQGSRYRGFPRHAAPLSRIPPANKNIIHAGPNGTAAKAGVRLSLREKTPFGAESKKLLLWLREGKAIRTGAGHPSSRPGSDPGRRQDPRAVPREPGLPRCPRGRSTMRALSPQPLPRWAAPRCRCFT